ncbi:outer membrane lipoprotein carrier protein LolA [Phytopseudomonas punonensis]|uniref:Outer membrane lipoprotein carrier protein LolA n=1 Tax=Phytopseudomonas punonensis TaxID=1220495 RepID=A0A1M6Z553_9GAMM|nr:outer membrane lipoprotein carrier protein LolA [Pseudomonas punonensis]SHL25628.1 Outer membrane lipoprotein carrier protein LolA [Pseudomonas punonensis]
MKILARLSLLIGLLLTALCSYADTLTLDALSKQLSQHPVVRGPFIQEKHLRALPQPLTSSGTFVLAADAGLLWKLEKPLKQDYRIDANGIAKRTADGWQMQPGRDVAAQQSKLFLDVLKGNHSGLARDFDLQLSGDPKAWTLALTPTSLLLKQVFSRIDISGGELVERIELHETQGDRTLMRMPASIASDTLSDEERSDFAH